MTHSNLLFWLNKTLLDAILAQIGTEGMVRGTWRSYKMPAIESSDEAVLIQDKVVIRGVCNACLESTKKLM